MLYTLSSSQTLWGRVVTWENICFFHLHLEWQSKSPAPAWNYCHPFSWAFIVPIRDLRQESHQENCHCCSSQGVKQPYTEPFFSWINCTCLGACMGSNTGASEMRCWVLLKGKQQINKKDKTFDCAKAAANAQPDSRWLHCAHSVCKERLTHVWLLSGRCWLLYLQVLQQQQLRCDPSAQPNLPTNLPKASGHPSPLVLLAKKVSVSLKALLIPTTVVSHKRQSQMWTIR